MKDFYRDRIETGIPTQLSLRVLDAVVNYNAGGEPDISTLEQRISNITGHRVKLKLSPLRSILIWGLPGKE